MVWILLFIIAFFVVIQLLVGPSQTGRREIAERDPDRIAETERARTNNWFSGS